MAQRLRQELDGLLRRVLDLPETTAGASRPVSDDESSSDETDDAPVVEPEDVRDVSRRTRGRPKKHLPVMEKFAKRRTCILCGASHTIDRCSKYQAFVAAVEHNERIVTGGHGRCSICRGIGHNKKSCGWVFKKKR